MFLSMLGTVLSIAAILLAALVMGYAMLKRTKKRQWWGWVIYLALLAGIALVLLLLWPSPSTVIAWLMVAGATVLCVSVVLLAALGWRTLLAPSMLAARVASTGPPGSEAKEKDIDEQLAAETFEGAFSLNPISMMENLSTGARGSDDLVETCLISIVVGAVAAFTYLGVLISYGLSTFLMPRPTSPTRRAARTALSFLYAAILFAGVLWLLHQKESY